MILVDANLLLYAHIVESPDHRAARAWLDGRLNDSTKVGLPWPSLLAFVRLMANPRVLAEPRPAVQSWRVVEMWLEQAPVWVPQPTERHRQILGAHLAQAGPSPNAVADAHLAALAVEHGLTLCTADRGFARFEGLRWENPLRRPPEDVPGSGPIPRSR